MSIDKSLIQEVRAITDAPILKCKKALEDAGGDKQKAIEILREIGAATAVKKGSRVACEGVVIAEAKDGHAVLLEVNSETDFTAKNEHFKGFVQQVLAAIFAHNPADIDALMALDAGGQTLEEVRQALVGRIGENIQVRRFALFTGTAAAYQHGIKIGVIVHLADGGSVDAGRDAAMQVAATNPLALDADGIPAESIEREKALFASQVKDMNKPANVIENIVKGKMNKFTEENTLLGQACVKDPKLKVRDYLQQQSTQVLQYTRFELGEGIEKKSVSFADEVEQAKGSVGQ
jgi:elongation factor Ts